jgi:hypothetical protein
MDDSFVSTARVDTKDVHFSLMEKASIGHLKTPYWKDVSD